MVSRGCAMLVALCLASCGVGTRINTQPRGAKLYVNGALVGETPVVYANPRGLPRRYHVEIRREGHEPLDFFLDARMTVGWGIAGALLLIPNLWAWSLASEYTFTLQRRTADASASDDPSAR